MTRETHTIILKEQCAESPPVTVETHILYTGSQLWIRPHGYGENCAPDGQGFPVGMEIWRGKLRLILFDDINEEEAQIIDLEQARETNRNAGGIKDE
jgi:hypothetical protein